ncbi:MAG: sigma-70 family RNA polymerase sigma factor [Terriglobales bacterium]|jgi:RNA polymerase sigma factor (TIGR02999 family)
MTGPSSSEITELLHAWRGGDRLALERLTPLVYEELHRMAKHYMARERNGHTLQTTALVNEVYLRLVKVKEVEWQDRAHFFAVSAQMMRRILTDFARSQGYEKRGGGARRVPLDEAFTVSAESTVDLVALEQALTRLEESDARKSKVVELRFFGGMTVEETAEVLQISSETVMRDWSMARAWLQRELDRGVGHEA